MSFVFVVYLLLCIIYAFLFTPDCIFSVTVLILVYVGMKLLLVDITFGVLMDPSDLSDFNATTRRGHICWITYYNLPTTQEGLCFAQPSLDYMQSLTESTIFTQLL